LGLCPIAQDSKAIHKEAALQKQTPGDIDRARSTNTSFEAARAYTLVLLRIKHTLRSKLPSGLGRWCLILSVAL